MLKKHPVVRRTTLVERVVVSVPELDRAITIDQWIRELSLLKDHYGGSAKIFPDAGANNVSFELEYETSVEKEKYELTAAGGQKILKYPPGVRGSGRQEV